MGRYKGITPSNGHETLQYQLLGETSVKSAATTKQCPLRAFDHDFATIGQ